VSSSATSSRGSYGAYLPVAAARACPIPARAIPHDEPSTARLGAPPDAPHSALVRHRLGITEGAPVDYHLGTVDVLEDGQNSLVVYSTEITPDELADVVGPSIEGGVQGLKAHLEGGS